MEEEEEALLDIHYVSHTQGRAAAGVVAAFTPCLTALGGLGPGRLEVRNARSQCVPPVCILCGGEVKDPRFRSDPVSYIPKTNQEEPSYNNYYYYYTRPFFVQWDKRVQRCTIIHPLNCPAPPPPLSVQDVTSHRSHPSPQILLLHMKFAKEIHPSRQSLDRNRVSKEEPSPQTHTNIRCYIGKGSEIPSTTYY